MADRTLLHSLAVTLTDADTVSDAELLRRDSDTFDAVAFELLVRRHAELVWSVCRSIHLADHQTAEDAFQATFLSLARKAGTIRHASAAGWLFRVARHTAIRSKRRVHFELANDVALEASPDLPEIAEVSRIVSDEVERLAPKFREPVLLCFYEGYSHAQAAERLGWAVGTVASRLARAKERLRTRLSNRGVTLPAVGLGLLVGGSAPAAVVRSAVNGAIGATTDAVHKLSTEVLRSMTLNKMKTTAVVFALLVLGGVGTAMAWQAQRDDKNVEVKGAKAKPEDDQKALQGKWKPAKIVSKEGEAPAEELKGMSWEIEGDKIFVVDKPGEDRKEEMSFALDPSKSPKHIDLTALTGPAAVKGKAMRGIYELKDGKLTICLRPPEIADEGRPTEFKADKDSRAAMIVLEKEEVKKPASSVDLDKRKVEMETFQSEYERFQGEWNLAAVEYADGVQDKATDVPNGGFTVNGHEAKLRIISNGKEDMGVFVISFDPMVTPKQINLTVIDGPKAVKGKVMPGINELKGSKLTIAVGELGMSDKTRPTQFKADKEKRVNVFVLDRVEKKK